MNKRENKKADTILGVTQFFTRNISILSADAPALTPLYNQLTVLNSELMNARMVANGKIKGATEETNRKRVNMESQALKVSGSMRAYFVTTNNAENAERAHITKSMLRNARQEGTLFLCDNLLIMAQDFVAEIVPFGVSASMLVDFKTDIDAFRESVLDTKLERKRKIAALKRILELLVDYDQLLKAISGIMAAIKSNHENVYNLFKKRIRIGKSGGGKGKKPTFEVTIEAGEVAMVANLEYSPKRSIKIKNMSAVELKWGLSETDNEFSSPAHALLPKAKSKKQSLTLAKSGNFLLLQNLNNQPVAVKIWVFEHKRKLKKEKKEKEDLK